MVTVTRNCLIWHDNPRQSRIETPWGMPHTRRYCSVGEWAKSLLWLHFYFSLVQPAWMKLRKQLSLRSFFVFFLLMVTIAVLVQQQTQKEGKKENFSHFSSRPVLFFVDLSWNNQAINKMFTFNCGLYLRGLPLIRITRNFASSPSRSVPLRARNIPGD